MKNYLIWLKSGACIEGEMTEGEAERLVEEYKGYYKSFNIRTFNDKEGKLYIAFDKIESIAINDIPEENNNIGFKR